MPVDTNAITPGSLPYGERAPTEALLGGLGGSAQGAPAPSAATPTPQLGQDPLQALMGGGVVPKSDLPLTDGLDVGPGFSPAAQRAAMPDSYSERLRAIAEFARTPHLRWQAKELLRRRARLYNAS